MAQRMYLVMLTAALASGPALGGADVVLYDGAQATSPAQQGWTYLTDPLFGAQATTALQDGFAHLDTLAAIEQKAGYFSRLPLFEVVSLDVPVLDRSSGFDVAFSLEIVQEQHVSAARAGFSMIILSADKKGLELAFWTDEVWAQSDSPIFSHGEQAATDTQRPVAYHLHVQGDNYQLEADGSPLLNGKIKDYSSFGLPYSLTNFLFFGDDTSSAGAHAAISSLTVTVAGQRPRVVPMAAMDQTQVAMIHWLD